MKKILFLMICLFLSACSLKKMAIRSASPLLRESATVVTRESHWDFFRSSTPANMKFVEILWEQDKENLKLLEVLIKGYGGYAFAVPESLYFEDYLKGEEDSKWKEEAIFFYTRAFDYGINYLSQKDISPKDLLSSNESELKKKLTKLSQDDHIALLYTAQAWGGLINLQKENITLISQLPIVKLFFDHVCENRASLEGNICEIFYAQYEASRPRMLGGNPEKAESLFSEAMKKYPHNLLIRVSYLQSVVLPAMDQEKYLREREILKKEFSLWEDLNRDELTNKSPYAQEQDLNLFNSIAKKRFSMMEKYQHKIF